ncbi:PREDICTED: cathepsin L1-like [Dipodomys ordii]|uniref:Cathepsin L1-like n=1 Tax=Dipodomys ordii TaxID=10020 RepID=A0A1S3GNI2_DIPOR|nr:PREDICTED: cathepsin L1-like [Dipodomys ordii]
MASTAPTFDHSLDAQWEEWKMEYNKTYSSSEEGQRRAIWEKTVRMIELHNEEYSQGKHSFTMGLNQFADLTKEEFRARSNGLLNPNTVRQGKPQESPVGDIPKSVD